nr:MCE family protein [Antrihabitans sp. YC2-6]
MAISFDTDGRGPSIKQLFLRGFIFIVVSAAVIALMVAKSNGDLDKKVQVTAALSDIGDGLPAWSDVKYRGVIVGSVASVTPSTEGGPNYVHIDLIPHYADSVASAVAARVVPANVFAVSSVQLVDNGDGSQLRQGAEIPEDRSQPTVQFQSALNKLRDVVKALGTADPTSNLGILVSIADATDRKGDTLVTAGSQLQRIVDELNTFIGPGVGTSTIQSLSEAVVGLNGSAPELVDALHNAVVPLRTLAEKRAELMNFLAAGQQTTGTIATAFENNTDQLVGITTDLTPVVGTVADNAGKLEPAFSRIPLLSQSIVTQGFGNTDKPTVKVIVSFSPLRQYTRADCPRYGQMAGPSCFTAPTSMPLPQLPPSLDPRTFVPPPSLVGSNFGLGGSVGPVRQRAGARTARAHPRR